MTTMSPRHKRKVEEKSVKAPKNGSLMPCSQLFLDGLAIQPTKTPLWDSATCPPNTSSGTHQQCCALKRLSCGRGPGFVWILAPLDPPPNEVAPSQRTVNDVRLRHKGDVASETEFGCLHRVDHVNTVLRQDLLSVSVKSSPPGINGFGQCSCITFLDGVQFLCLPAEGCQDRGDKCCHARRYKERFVRERWCQDLRRSQSAQHAGADGSIVVTTERDHCSQESEPERPLDHVSCEHKRYTLACHGAAEVCLAQV